jgi:hypothetical protein
MKTTILSILLILFSLGVYSNETTKQIDKHSAKVEEGVSTVYNDSKDIVKTAYSDIKDLTPKIEQAIISISNGLKTTAVNVWDILIKQQLVWSVCYLILTLSAIFNWWLFYNRLKPNPKNISYITLKRPVFGEGLNPTYDNYYTKHEPSHPRAQLTIPNVEIGEEEYSCPQIAPDASNNTLSLIFKYTHLAACISLSLLSIYHFTSMLTGFINPKYGALLQITEIALQLK